MVQICSLTQSVTLKRIRQIQFIENFNFVQIIVVKMSLKPRRILFDEVWGCLRKTVEEVITLKTVNRDDWNNSFK